MYDLWYLLKRWNLTPADLAILILGGVVTLFMGIAGWWLWFLPPLPLAVIVIEILHILKIEIAFRFRMCVTAQVVSHRSEIRKEYAGKYQPPNEVVYWAPVVEFETENGTVTADYPVFRRERWFERSKSYEICYSVDNPERFYFLGRRYELWLDNWIRIMVAAVPLGLYLPVLITAIYG